MKIVFICGSLEPGQDGVGDYTRLLAAELLRQGYRASILALNDGKINTIFCGIQQSGGIEISVLRLPASMSGTEKSRNALIWINRIDPEWLSLQYVPFGFHPKGLPVGLSKLLISFSKGRKWHVMFHELWVGMAVEEPVKLILWGLLQKQLLKSFLLNLKPQIVHTQTALYQAQLFKLGFKALYLPLFSNIAVVNKLVSENDETIKPGGHLFFVVFGTIHTGAPIADFASEAAVYAKKNNVIVKLTFVGRCGAEQERWRKIWGTFGLPSAVLGELDASRISEILTNSTLGISATATAVIEKSGSFAAMRSHGLPVISVSKPWQPRGMPKQITPSGIIMYQPGNFDKCVANRTQIPHLRTEAEITKEFINCLIK